MWVLTAGSFRGSCALFQLWPMMSSKKDRFVKRKKYTYIVESLSFQHSHWPLVFTSWKNKPSMYHQVKYYWNTIITGKKSQWVQPSLKRKQQKLACTQRSRWNYWCRHICKLSVYLYIYKKSPSNSHWTRRGHSDLEASKQKYTDYYLIIINGDKTGRVCSYTAKVSWPKFLLPEVLVQTLFCPCGGLS